MSFRTLYLRTRFRLMLEDQMDKLKNREREDKIRKGLISLLDRGTT